MPMLLPFGLYGYAISVSVISVMIALAGIITGLGYATNNKKFKEFGLEEISQSVINGMLIGSMMLLFASNGIVGSIINALTLSNGTSMSCQQFMQDNIALCLAYNYLVGSGYTMLGVYHQSILASTSELLTLLFALNATLGVIASIGVNIFGFTLSFGPAIAPVLNTTQYIIKALTTVAIGSLVQSSVLIFIAISALTILMPLGLILRTFYPTRKLGGFIIATVLGTYIVLPLSYVLNAFIAGTYTSAVDTSGINQVTASATAVQRSLLNANTQNRGIIALITGAVSSLISSFGALLNSLMQALSFFIVYTFILPAFSLILTAVSIKEFSRVLGGETSFWILDIL